MTHVLWLLLWLSASLAQAHQDAPGPGESIYRLGLLPSGKPLVGERDAGIRVEASAAACATCHRRSGLGMAEGQNVIPPITGKYLFRPLGTGAEDVDFRYTQSFRIRREAYTEATLVRAIRDGIGRDGRKLNYLMPRFNLDDVTLATLIAYLKDLSSDLVPGVTADTLHFATIITPDADPIERQGMLAVLDRFFADKNEFLRGGNRPMQSFSGVHFRVTRKWQLHVWQLTGTPDTWEEQLNRRIAADPVFAIVSGLGGKTWAPVHRFCEKAAVPCLLPNVDLPVLAESDFYTVYFSRGVLLEAQLIARWLRERRDRPTLHRLVQVFREDDIGAESAQALSRATSALDLVTESRRLPAGRGELALSFALKDIRPDDALVLWLRPDDLNALPAELPPGSVVFISGLMAGLEHAPLPIAWRGIAHMTYPADLPEQRKVRMNFPLGWFKVRNISVVAERVQTDTYLACGIVAENLTDMLDSFVRDYLLERIEVMVSRKITTGYYPRLSLAQGQRFASKGGYLVRFAESTGPKLVAESDWVVP